MPDSVKKVDEDTLYHFDKAAFLFASDKMMGKGV